MQIKQDKEKYNYKIGSSTCHDFVARFYASKSTNSAIFTLLTILV